MDEIVKTANVLVVPKFVFLFLGALARIAPLLGLLGTSTSYPSQLHHIYKKLDRRIPTAEMSTSSDADARPMDYETLERRQGIATKLESWELLAMEAISAGEVLHLFSSIGTGYPG